jgi:hypothetical protein
MKRKLLVNDDNKLDFLGTQAPKPKKSKDEADDRTACSIWQTLPQEIADLITESWEAKTIYAWKNTCKTEHAYTIQSLFKRYLVNFYFKEHTPQDYLVLTQNNRTLNYGAVKYYRDLKLIEETLGSANNIVAKNYSFRQQATRGDCLPEPPGIPTSIAQMRKIRSPSYMLDLLNATDMVIMSQTYMQNTPCPNPDHVKVYCRVCSRYHCYEADQWTIYCNTRCCKGKHNNHAERVAQTHRFQKKK